MLDSNLSPMKSDKSMKPARVTLEICTASVRDCVVAEKGGADRVELNSALLLGGLTASLGTLHEARRAIRIPIIAMIRPRSGGFDYSRADILVMQRDIELALAAGADGIAFGILKADATIDRKRCREMVKLTPGR
jgi:copper homeostasis protein